MSTPISVSFSSLQATQESLQQALNHINSQLEDLKSFLAPMISSWTGAASEHYQAAQKKWDQSATDLNTVLTQIEKALGQANEGYQRTEGSITNRW